MDKETTNPNPYQSGSALNTAPRTRASRTRAARWMIGVGVVLSAFCLLATVVGMMVAFDARYLIACPQAGGFGQRYQSLMPLFFSVPLTLGGIGFLILGLLRR